MRFIKSIFKLTIIFSAIYISTAWAQDQDPPTRAAQLSYTSGAVSMQPAGVNDWAPVEVNRPFSTGDYLYTDQKAIAELRLDSAVFRMGEVTSFGFLNLSDQIAQLKLTEGDLYFRVHNLAPSQVYEIDTPNAAITLLREGIYRIHVDPNSNSTFLVVREGQAEVTGGGQAFTLNPGQSANLSGADQLAYDIEQAPAPDSLDDWCIKRDQRAMQASATRYVPPSMVGYEDLDQYGSWDQAPQYGPVWYPTHVDPGWAPYHVGHWAWIEPWGWTWVDAQPWGFAPCHYGRWVYWHDRWGWAPGPAVRVGIIARPVYAPALVAWFGGAHWGVSIGIGGGGPSLGWVPLGYGEVYTPHYHCSPNYFNRVNVSNTRIVNNVNITNVYKTVYVQHNTYNQTFVNVNAPRAVVAMPASAMANGQSVAQVSHPVPQAQIAQLRTAQVVAPSVVPNRAAVAPGLGQSAPRPSQAFAERAVVAKATPPTQVAPFAARQAFLQQHVGQPHDFTAMHAAVQSQARPAVAEVRQAPRAEVSQVHVGQRVGNPPPPNNLGRPQTQPGPAANALRQNNQPNAQGRVTPPSANQPNAVRPNENQPNANRPNENQPVRPAVADHGQPPNLRGPRPGQDATVQPHNVPSTAPNRPQTYPQPRNQAPEENNARQNPPAPRPNTESRPDTTARPNYEQQPREQPAPRPQVETQHGQPPNHPNEQNVQQGHPAEHNNSEHVNEHKDINNHGGGEHKESKGDEHKDNK